MVIRYTVMFLKLGQLDLTRNKVNDPPESFFQTIGE